MRLAVVPARGGSKRIPRKNIRPFLGVPLLARCIGILQQSAVFDRIVVSTDDAEIADVARDAGAEVPFWRPRDLADDYAGTLPVVAHAIEQVVAAGVVPELVCCAYPAAVLVVPMDYERATAMLDQPEIAYVFTATSFPYPIQRALRQLSHGGCAMFQPEHRETRSQDLEHAYHDAGQFYVGRPEAWRSGLPMFTHQSRMLLLPRHRVQDIDTEEDWRRAELLYRLMAEA